MTFINILTLVFSGITAIIVVGSFVQSLYYKEEDDMASQELLDTISTLQAELAANTSATQSAEALIAGFAQQLTDAIAKASDDTAAVAALKDVIAHFQANDTALARAVAANTPGAPQVEPLPPVTPPST